MADALLVVAPWFKTLNQPLLGPAMLVGAGRTAGHTVGLVDLNQPQLRAALPHRTAPEAAPFVGDHNRPSDLLREGQRAFSAVCRAALGDPGPTGLPEDPALTLAYSHEAVEAAARALAAGPLGARIRQTLRTRRAPDLVGLSVFWSGQVLVSLVVTIVARELWPGVRIVWGGPHVTALEQEIARDVRYGSVGIDAFVFGYAETTWVDLLAALDAGAGWPLAARPAGSGAAMRAVGDPTVRPDFIGLDSYGWGRLCLPIQASRGCAYARCAHCTYPVVEGGYSPVDLAALEPTLVQAAVRGATVAFKDALVTPGRLAALAERCAGRVEWSACTKLHRRLDGPFLARLADGGCRTLEVGLETLTDAGQLVLDKRQGLPLFLALLDAAAAAGISVVVNYMMGVPGVPAAEERRWHARLRSALAARPTLVAKIELNVLQVERRSRIGVQPAGFGLQVVQTWPWASVVAWEPLASIAAR